MSVVGTRHSHDDHILAVDGLTQIQKQNSVLLVECQDAKHLLFAAGGDRLHHQDQCTQRPQLVSHWQRFSKELQ